MACAYTRTVSSLFNPRYRNDLN